MHGHEPLIAMRKAGKRPGIVFLNDYPDPCEWAQWGDHATICVHGDTPERLDLRCLIGLTVSITGATVERAKRLMEACKSAGAVIVAAGAPELVGRRIEGNWSAVWRKELESVNG